MSAELNIGAKIEAPDIIENETGASKERPDLNLEKSAEKQEKSGETAEEVAAVVMPAAPAKNVVSEYEEREKQIENFLARDLEEIYLGLPIDKQAEFRKAGEETAQKINKLLEHARINIGKIVGLIRKWLALIPGVNKFFLEQEAKIKADEIVRLRKK
jgi:hypothetical protein